MSSLRRIRRNKCTGKVRFETRAQAGATIRALRHVNGARHPETLRPYFCRFCKGYHYGHAGAPHAANSALSSAL
jgi:hypothetical protein